MRILVLSFYFPPDLSAGSFRVAGLVDALVRRAPPGTTIDIVTTLPNRYRTFSAEAPCREQRGPVSIVRIPLPPHQSGMMDQSRAFMAFVAGVGREIRPPYEVVVATSSRLMTAVLGAWVARMTRAPLLLDIRDIFADTIGDVARGTIASLTRPAFAFLERWAITRASRVNLVSPGFASYFQGRYPARRFSYLTNGIDEEFVGTSAEISTVAAQPPYVVLYAGNLGEGQGLHVIVPELARRMAGRIHFVIVGDGGRRVALERAVAASGVTNVEIRDPVARPALLELYRRADVLFVHLNDYPAFRKVLPSKLFEYAALGKPLWAGVAGYAASFIETEIDNAAVFPPCDAEAAVGAFESLRLQSSSRPDFVAKYSRHRISDELASEVLAVAGDSGH